MNGKNAGALISAAVCACVYINKKKSGQTAFDNATKTAALREICWRVQLLFLAFVAHKHKMSGIIIYCSRLSAARGKIVVSWTLVENPDIEIEIISEKYIIRLVTFLEALLPYNL